jgi:hypothetical protein
MIVRDPTTIHSANRLKIIDELKRELVGPAPAGIEIDPTQPVVVESAAEAWGPWLEKGTGEEILVSDPPSRRYGVGVLFPVEILAEEDTGSLDDQVVPEKESNIPPQAVIVEPSEDGPEEEGDELDLSLSNSYKPSSFAISFLARFEGGARLIVEAGGARYEKREVGVRVGGTEQKRFCWIRRPVRLRLQFEASAVDGVVPRKLSPDEVTRESLEALDISVEVFSRPYADGRRLVTASLVNRTQQGDGDINSQCLFQCWLKASVSDRDGRPGIMPYPNEAGPAGDAESASAQLLYRRMQAFATGHGCSADWQESDCRDRAAWVGTSSLPFVETPAITPDITKDDGTPLTVSMADLAGLRDERDGFRDSEEIVERYEEWIRRQHEQESLFEGILKTTARKHLIECERMAERMRRGLDYLRTDPKARRAFQLANHACLLQQIATASAARAFRYDQQKAKLVFDEPLRNPDQLDAPVGRGTWRAFQIAFLLAAVNSAVDPGDPDRMTVELIWFPTGGGKTEAYLALSAFAAFRRRLEDPSDAGVHVLMRYTLRLLTTQQFQRAAALVCAMEHLRRTNNDLGREPFSIGIWVGGGTTPNTRERAIDSLSELRRPEARNRFLVDRCPWCAARFGRLELSGGRAVRRSPTITPGYARGKSPKTGAETVLLHCPDVQCEFSSGLPVFVVDEDIYEVRPTLIVGTIDKFAMLAWRPEACALFGLEASGERSISPPGLIIQDELHLISGPLGSLAGLYEAVIEELCTDRRGAEVPPKIICSTATTRNFHDQIRGLYARTKCALFPPPGLDADDSFFARADAKSPGRIYVGVHAASLGSVQTEWVRALTSLFQAPMCLADQERDPWSTLLIFFNSIREMGTAHTLFQTDIPDYQAVIWKRQHVPNDRRRYCNAAKIFELMGGLSSGDLANALARLETPLGEREAVDVCLASNVIEVGIDIQRLCLLVVAGQPKTTSQYIQVSGRVGRVRDRPALVVTLYSPSKPRDRSHYERFKAYHSRLYASVEPSSVTPFSPPAVERALHAALVTFVRMTAGIGPARSPYPFPSQAVARFEELIRKRVKAVDLEEQDEVLRVLELRKRQWSAWERTSWWDPSDADSSLLRAAGEYADSARKQTSWATPMSMRHVDAQCEAEITSRYLDEIVTNDEKTTS